MDRPNLNFHYDFASIKAGDYVTVRDAHGSTRTGRAQMLLTNPDEGTVVLNMGGKHGTTLVCTLDNFIRARRPA